jgi:hypothetical protein
MLSVITLIGLGFFAGWRHSWLGLVGVVIIALVRYGCGLTLDQLPPKREPEEEGKK